jgi:hypothetical protein
MTRYQQQIEKVTAETEKRCRDREQGMYASDEEFAALRQLAIRMYGIFGPFPMVDL